MGTICLLRRPSLLRPRNLLFPTWLSVVNLSSENISFSSPVLPFSSCVLSIYLSPVYLKFESCVCIPLYVSFCTFFHRPHETDRYVQQCWNSDAFMLKVLTFYYKKKPNSINFIFAVTGIFIINISLDWTFRTVSFVIHSDLWSCH